MTQVRLNLDVLEAFLFFWSQMQDKIKVPEKFILELAAHPDLQPLYTQDFSAESVRRILSAISNKEALNALTKAEARFWNNNLWMLEDKDHLAALTQAVKTLRLDSMHEANGALLKALPYEDVMVSFIPWHLVDFQTIGSHIYINFFSVKPEVAEGTTATVQGMSIQAFVRTYIQ